jgi:mono/diheme cytochrome c family protein
MRAEYVTRVTGRREFAWVVVGAAVTFAWMLLALTASAQAQTAAPRSLLDGSLVGRENFEAYCASCHGRSGRGNGPLAAELVTPPADLTTLSTRNGGRFPRAAVAAYVEGSGRPIPAHGPTSMPVWGPIFRIFDPDERARARIANLVGHIESLQRRE